MSKAGSRGPSLDQAPETASTAAAAEPRAIRILAEYLRAWGLRDPQTIATLSSHWVRCATTTRGTADRTLALDETYRASIGRAAVDMERWLDQLTVCAGVTDIAGRRGLLAVELQRVIDRFPGAILEQQVPAELLTHLVGAAAHPVVPTRNARHMPTQSFGASLSASFLDRARRAWRRIRRQDIP